MGRSLQVVTLGGMGSYRRRHLRSPGRGGRWPLIGAVVALVLGVVVVAGLALQRPSGPEAGATPRPIPTFDTPREIPSRVLFLGDSYTSGTPNQGGVGDDGWPARTCVIVGCSLTMAATGGAGFVGGESNGRGVTQQLEAVPGTTAPRIVVLALGANDYNATTDELSGRVDTVIDSITQRWPEAELVILGPFWINSNPPGSILFLEQYLQDKAIQAGAVFASPIREGWLSGLIGPDNVHPESAGHEAIATHVAPILLDLGANESVIV